MKKPIIPFIALAALAVLALCGRPAPAADNKYVFEVTMLEGLSAGSLSNMVKNLASTLSKKCGVAISPKEVRYNKGSEDEVFRSILDNFKSGQVDFALIHTPQQYMKYKSEVDKYMVPFFALSLDNKKEISMCVYARRDNPGKTIGDFKGKTWGGTSTLQPRYVMIQNGITATMKDFFGKLIFIDDATITTVLDALLAKKIDVFVSPGYIVHMALGGNKKYITDIKEVGCVPYEHTWFFVYRKGTPKDLVDKIKTIMTNSGKDKDFNQFKFMLAAVKGQFTDINTADLGKTEKIYGVIKKYNLEKEERDFIKANR